jgi:two-component sensor histidine kinase/CheY-like chemotaxis protein
LTIAAEESRVEADSMTGSVAAGVDEELWSGDRTALALTAAGVAEFEWDFRRERFWVTPRLAALTGLRPGQTPTQHGPVLYGYVHPDDLADLKQAIEGGGRIGEAGEAKFRLIRPDDRREIWLKCNTVAVGDSRGRPLRVVGVVRDITLEKGEADQMIALIAELDHRVKNVLASVESLAAQSARRTTSLEAFLKTFFGRLQAIAAAHTLLTATRWRGAEITHIAAAELGGLAQGQARWHGPEIVLNPRATRALTLALHELSANAVKYGALSTDTGRIELEWRARPDDGFDLVWTEFDGPIVSPPTRRGFGSTLLEQVTGRELGGCASLDFRPEGLRVVLSAGKSARAGAPGQAPAAPEPMALPDLAVLAEPAREPPSDARGEPDVRDVRVLIVEDSVLLAGELEVALTACGAKVVGMATEPGEALAMLDRTFDVAVLDANLNGRSVAPVAGVLAERGAPFIFATGYGEAGTPPAGFVAPVVRKPYNVREIASALMIALGRS